MKITESELSNQILASVKNKIGSIFFFSHIAIVEINEGIHFDIENASEITNELISYFGEIKPFGIVANRVNSYSINLLDAQLYREKMKNLRAYGVVGHSPSSKMDAALENCFCISKKVDYENIYDAVNAVCKQVKKYSLFSIIH